MDEIAQTLAERLGPVDVRSLDNPTAGLAAFTVPGMAKSAWMPWNGIVPIVTLFPGALGMRLFRARCFSPVIVTLALLLRGVPSVADDSAARSDTGTWPVFRGNTFSTGVATSSLPSELELIWQYAVKDGAFEATPVIAEGVVYIGDLDGNVYALDLRQGTERWKKKLDTGFTSAAAIRDKQLFLGDIDGRLHSLDPTTGEVLWTFETEGEISAGANFHGANVLVGSQDGALYCVDAKSGKSLWKFSIENQIRCTPTAVENRAFVAGCDGQLHIVDLANGQSLGQVDIKAPTGVTPAVMGDHLFFGTEGGLFFCVDWKLATVVWTFEDGQHQQPIRSAPAVTEGKVVFGGRSKKIYCLDASDGHRLWEFTTRQRVDAAPVIVKDRVIAAAGDGRMYSLDLETGKELWQFEAGGGFTGSPAVASERLVIANEDGVVYCFGSKSQ